MEVHQTIFNDAMFLTNDEKPFHWLDKVNKFLYQDFIFSSRYRIWRHIIYWAFHVCIWALFWKIMGEGRVTYARLLFNMSLWVPVFILFSYPMVYITIPKLLLKGLVWQFLLVVLLWAIVGLFINSGFRTYIYVPLQEFIGFHYIPLKGNQPQSYLCMTTSAASPMIIRFFKLWTLKQQEWKKMQEEKLHADLQLLKGQMHPRFFIKTLETIYDFSIKQPVKTPDLILKLSNLLSYILYECKEKHVRLGKDLEMMQAYAELENDRSMGKVDISWSVSPDVYDQFIAPLLILPLLENVFKHGISGNISKSWLSVDVSVKHNTILYKIANSKDPSREFGDTRAGINNLRTRLNLLYPGMHEFKLHDECNFFVVSLMIKLYPDSEVQIQTLMKQDHSTIELS